MSSQEHPLGRAEEVYVRELARGCEDLAQMDEQAIAQVQLTAHRLRASSAIMGDAELHRAAATIDDLCIEGQPGWEALEGPARAFYESLLTTYRARTAE